MQTIEEFLKETGFDLSNRIQTEKATIAMEKAIVTHVTAALNAAVRNISVYEDGNISYDSILSAYPLTNII